MGIQLLRAASTGSRSSSRRRASAARGTTTAIPGSRATSRRTSTRSPSSPSPTGRGPTARSRRSSRYLEHCADEVRPAARTCGSATAVTRGALGRRRRACGTRRPTDAGRRASSSTSSSPRVGMFNDLNCPTSRARLFAGTRFHSARWDHDHDLTGERVGGDRQRGERGAVHARDRASRPGSSLFQRTANWVLPEGRRRPTPRSSSSTSARDPDASPRCASEIFERVDALITFSNPDACAKAERAGLARTSRSCEDPELRASSRPTLPYGLQAPADLERLLPDVQPRQRRARHRPDRAHRRPTAS